MGTTNLVAYLHQTRFVTPVTNEAFDEVMKDGIPQKTKAIPLMEIAFEPRERKHSSHCRCSCQWLHSNLTFHLMLL